MLGFTVGQWGRGTHRTRQWGPEHWQLYQGSCGVAVHSVLGVTDGQSWPGFSPPAPVCAPLALGNPLPHRYCICIEPSTHRLSRGSPGRQGRAPQSTTAQTPCLPRKNLQSPKGHPGPAGVGGGGGFCEEPVSRVQSSPLAHKVMDSEANDLTGP